MKTSQLLSKSIDSAPYRPGCYIYRDKVNTVIYVGKAKSLKNRVSSYFASGRNHSPKIKQLITKIVSIEYVITNSELEAIILETNLIKKYSPKYNKLMKDDKNYIWIMIDKAQDFPRIQVVREKKIKNAHYLGPYDSTLPIRRLLKNLRKIFPFRDCTRSIKVKKDQDGDFNNEIIISSDIKPCLYYQLNLCNAPCAGYISKQNYNNKVNKIKKFFNSRQDDLIEELAKEMYDLATNKNFEEAALVRDNIEDLRAINHKIIINQHTDEIDYNLNKQSRRKKGLHQLLTKIELDINDDNPIRIECYDISNIQGTNATGSMIVFIDGKPSKKDYRKFKIKTKSTPDDFAMMKEVLKRRFSTKNLKSGKFDLPNLVIVDGGKGQLSSAYSIFQQMNIIVPLVGLAKREEEIFKIKINKDGTKSFLKNKFRSNSPGKFLIQNIRDESHRFAINYHRKLRSIGQTMSVLDSIPGVGKVTKKKLLMHFGSTQKISKASIKELNKVIKNKNTARNIKKILQ